MIASLRAKLNNTRYTSQGSAIGCALLYVHYNGCSICDVLDLIDIVGKKRIYQTAVRGANRILQWRKWGVKACYDDPKNWGWAAILHRCIDVCRRLQLSQYRPNMISRVSPAPYRYLVGVSL